MLVRSLITTLAGLVVAATGWAADTTGVLFSNETQQPQGQITIEATAASGERVTTTSDSDGSFTLNLPTGTWTVSVVSPNGFTFTTPPFNVGDVGAELLIGLVRRIRILAL